MLLTISTEHKPATGLPYLLHKHPDRFQTFDLSFGQAHVFYPEVTEDRCTACLLLDVDPVGKGRGHSNHFLLADQHGYSVRFVPVGADNGKVGSPTQMGVFARG